VSPIVGIGTCKSDKMWYMTHQVQHAGAYAGCIRSLVRLAPCGASIFVI